MSDLTLDEISELKEEEIKLRLLEDYNIISYGKGIPEDTDRQGAVIRTGIKLSYHSIKTQIIKQIKTILFKSSIFPKSIGNNP